MNSALEETSNEPSSSAISAEVLFNDVCNEETLNVNQSLSATIENKRYINYIQTLTAQILQKMLWKIVQKSSLL